MSRVLLETVNILVDTGMTQYYHLFQKDLWVKLARTYVSQTPWKPDSKHDSENKQTPWKPDTKCDSENGQTPWKPQEL
jgi:hypothetical protein